jgi:hypothetical protein
MALTTNYGITLLNGSDTAGYSSINTVIQSVDSALNTKTNVIGMIMIFDTSLGKIPTNWSNLTNTVAGLPTLSGNYVWIKKTAL